MTVKREAASIITKDDALGERETNRVKAERPEWDSSSQSEADSCVSASKGITHMSKRRFCFSSKK